MFKNTKFVEFIKSLRFRLLVILLAVAIIPATLLGQILLNAYKARAIAIKESEISSQATILADQIATSGYLEEYKSVNDINMTRLKLQMDMLTTIYEGRIIVVNKDYRIISDSYDLDTDKMIVSEEVVNCFEKATSSVASSTLKRAVKSVFVSSKHFVNFKEPAYVFISRNRPLRRQSSPPF